MVRKYTKKAKRVPKGQSPSAKAIRAFRGYLKMSQRELGELIGTGQSTIANFESNRPVSLGAAKAMVREAKKRRYMLTLDELHGIENEPDILTRSWRRS
jgi:DNA-binding transcriptional regulator YiaG